MTFYFLGVFAAPSSILAAGFSETWPEGDVVELTVPFKAVGVRLPECLLYDDPEVVPEGVATTARAISKRHPEARFMVLCTYCWGGLSCLHAVQIIQDGETIASIDGEDGLQRGLRYFDVELGKTQYFEPLRRDYPWARPGK